MSNTTVNAIIALREAIEDRFEAREKKYTIKNMYNYDYKEDSDPEKNINPVSITVKGEAYSVAEMYAKHASGVTMQHFRNGVFDGDPDFEDVDMNKAQDLDLVDKAKLLKKAAFVQHQAKLEEEKRAKQKEVEKPETETEPEPEPEKPKKE